MHLEVEIKFRVTSEVDLESRLTALGVQWGSTVEQSDVYFAHPARDFARTDEALRIRSVGDQSWITYKGPKLDQATKTRQEIELPLGSEERTAGRWAELLESLGFRKVMEVRKTRRIGHFLWQGHEVEVALDEVPQLGSFIELETASDEDTADPARAALTELADELGLHDGIRASYLEMLLARGA